jgi:hypothetical protein
MVLRPGLLSIECPEVLAQTTETLVADIASIILAKVPSRTKTPVGHQRESNPSNAPKWVDETIVVLPLCGRCCGSSGTSPHPHAPAGAIKYPRILDIATAIEVERKSQRLAMIVHMS